MKNASWYLRAWRWLARRPVAQNATPRRQLPAKPGSTQQYSFSSELDRTTTLGTSALSIASLFTAFDEADCGYPANQIDIYEKRIQTDPHLFSLVDDRLNVANSLWTIQEGGKDSADKAAAVALEKALRNVPNFGMTLTHQLMAVQYGWSCSETDWRRIDGVTVPVRFADAAHRRFIFDKDTDAPLLVTDTTNFTGTPLLPGKWWYSRRWGRIAAASGLMRAAAIYSHFKSLGVRDWMVFADRFGIPYVTGEYEEGASDTDIAVLESAVASLGSDGYAVFSKLCSIATHTIQSGGGTDVHGKISTFCNAEMSKLIAGATLTSESTGNASYAIGQVHESRGHQLKVGDANWLSQSFAACVGQPFVAFNNMDAAPPRLRLHPDLEISAAGFVGIASTCANELGLPIDEDQIREKTTLRRPTGEALVGTKTGGTPTEETEDVADDA